MATLNPQISAGGGIESPVPAPPSALEGLASIVGGVLSNIQEPEKPEKISMSDQESLAKKRYWRQYKLSRQAASEGDMSKARRLASDAYREWTSIYGQGADENIDSSFEDSTGISTRMETTGSPIDESAVTNTPEYQTAALAYQAKNPNADPNEVHSAAYSVAATRLVNQQRVEAAATNDQLSWIDVRGTYTDLAISGKNTINGMITLAREDEVTTPEEAQAIRSYYRQFFNSFNKPVNVPDDQWSEFKSSYLKPIEVAVNGVIDLSETASLGNDTKRALTDIMDKAFQQGKLPAWLMVSFEAGGRDPERLMQMLKQHYDTGGDSTAGLDKFYNSTFEELLTWVTEFEFQQDLSQLQLDLTEWKKLSGPEKAKQIEYANERIGIDTDPATIASFVHETNQKILNLPSSAMSVEQFGRVFSRSYFEAIANVSQANPRIGRQLAREGLQAINTQSSNISRALQSAARQIGFKITDDRVGTVRIDPESMPPMARRYVEVQYGGNWDLAWEAYKRKEIEVGLIMSEDGRVISSTELFTVFQEAETNLIPRIEKYQQAREIANEFQEKFFTEDVIGKTAREALYGGDVELQGNTGSDTLEGTLMLDILDRTEGGGEYDTLFNFSNRSGGAFAGTDITQMTIGELKDFANGPYGAWSREVLGYKATPMGRYQFVGTTLSQVAKEMGLSENTVFTDRVQDAMFHHHAKKTLARASSPASKRKVMREQWEGFKKVSNAELDRAIAQFEGTNPPSYTELQRDSRNMQTAPTVSARPEPTPRDVVTSTDVGGETTTSAQQPQRATESATEQPSRVPEGEGSGEPSKAAVEAAQREYQQLSDEQKAFLERLLGTEEEIIKRLAIKYVDEEKGV